MKGFAVVGAGSVRTGPAFPLSRLGNPERASGRRALCWRDRATAGGLNECAPVVSAEFECAGEKVHRGALRSDGAAGLQVPQRSHSDVCTLGQLELGEAGRPTQFAQQ